MIPERVAKAIADRASNSPTSVLEGVRVGDLRVISAPQESGAPSRVGLVTKIRNSDNVVEIMLCHPYPEMAADTDLVVSQNEAHASYSLVIQTDMRSFVWMDSQVGRAVGWLSSSSLDDVDRVALGSDALGLGRVGRQLRGLVDFRTSFKMGERESVDQLSDDCVVWMLQGGVLSQLDPGLFDPELINGLKSEEAKHQYFASLQSFLQRSQDHDFCLDGNDLDILSKRGAFSLESWRRAAGSSFGDMLYQSINTFLFNALTLPSDDHTHFAFGKIEGWKTGETLSGPHGDISIRSKRVVTSAHLWIQGIPKSSGQNEVIFEEIRDYPGLDRR